MLLWDVDVIGRDPKQHALTVRVQETHADPMADPWSDNKPMVMGRGPSTYAYVRGYTIGRSDSTKADVL